MTQGGKSMFRTNANKSKPNFTRSRIVALVLIGVLVLGLAYLRFAPDAGIGLRARRRACRRADPPSVQLRDREGQLRRRLRDARRPREPRQAWRRG